MKTRLIPALGAEAAAALYHRLLRSTVCRLVSAEIAPLVCCCAPSTEHPAFQSLSTEYGVELETQIGADLGERMEQAVCSRLAEGGPVVLIGGDCPQLQPSHVLQALYWLSGDCDAVIGPAEDGGYVLLGLNRSSSNLFYGITWGGDSVLSVTRDRIRRLGWRWRELETLWDLDRPSDLARLP